MAMIKCFSLRCGEEFEVDEKAAAFDSREIICPKCGGSNMLTSGVSRYRDREHRNEKAKEFQNEVSQQG